MKTQGRIHSYEVGSTVDGPGLRFVVFTQGCPLRCLYCHNPDTRDPHQGQEVTVGNLIRELNKYHSYFDRGHGGLTVSGGEPLLQPEFVASLFREAKANGIHTALDTSGFCSHHSLDLVLPDTDLVLLDIKSSHQELYRRLTHVDLQVSLETAKYLNRINKPCWIRFVLVPGLTDATENIEGVAQICADLDCIERIEILGFHKLGEYKWKELGLSFQLVNARVATAEDLRRAKFIFEKVLKHRGKQISVIG